MNMTEEQSWFAHTLIAVCVYFITFGIFSIVNMYYPIPVILIKIISLWTTFVVLLTIEGTQIESALRSTSDIFRVLKEQLSFLDRYMDVIIPMGVVLIIAVTI